MNYVFCHLNASLSENSSYGKPDCAGHRRDNTSIVGDSTGCAAGHDTISQSTRRLHRARKEACATGALDALVERHLSAQNLAVVEAGAERNIRLERDERSQDIARACLAQRGRVEGGLEEEEREVGRLEGGEIRRHVHHSLRATGDCIADRGPQRRGEAGQRDAGGGGCGDREDAERAGVVFGANGITQRCKGVERFVNRDDLAVGAGRELRRAVRVEMGEGGAESS